MERMRDKGMAGLSWQVTQASHYRRHAAEAGVVGRAAHAHLQQLQEVGEPPRVGPEVIPAGQRSAGSAANACVRTNGRASRGCCLERCNLGPARPAGAHRGVPCFERYRASQLITLCGISGAAPTSLTREAGREIAMKEVKDVLAEEFRALFAHPALA